MQEKSIILTPNKRLSRHLQKRFCESMFLQNREAWYSAKILPINAWLIAYWQECSDPRILLTSSQEKLIWQKIIDENLGESFSSLRDMAINFHALLNNWEIKNVFSPKNQTEDIVIFQSLYQKFDDYLKKNDLVTLSELPTLIIPYLPEFGLSKIILAGFDEYNPQLQSVIEAIERTGCKVSKIDPNNYQNSYQKRLGVNNLNQEIYTSANWAKQIINNKPQANIGIVVPNLVELRAKVSQIFTEVFEDTKYTNISTGIPLKTLPIVHYALELISLTEPFSIEAISSILLSPYIAGSEIEKSQRFLLNWELQHLGTSQFNLADIKKLAKKYQKNIPIIINALEKWQKLQSIITNKKLQHDEWIQFFTKILKIFGWPGETNLTNIETSAINHLIQQLQELTTINLFTDKISHKKASQILRELVTDATLQPESKIDAPVQIVGTLEAAGINFDHLWIMGVDEENWPRVPKPNPFIPIAVQKKLSLPHSSVERELHFCKTLIERYKRSAKEIIFSYVNQIDDRRILPSSLISDIPETSFHGLNLNQTSRLPEKIYASQKLEGVTDSYAPKLNSFEIPHAPSRLLELQSLCPFQAFMEFRLKTKEFKKPSIGISKIDRGIIIHNLLEEFWQKIKNHKNLCGLNADELQKIIIACIEKYLTKLNLSKPLYDLEKKCLIPLLNKLFIIEKERYPFTVIATEKSVEIKISSVPIKLRIDRIDYLDNGKTVLLDYKTGKKLPSTFDWFKQRPENIQLLLYSLTIDPIEGLAFLQLNAEATKFKNIGLEELAANLRATNPDNYLQKEITWHELIEYWRNVLTNIASEFSQGYAAVSPASPQVCKRCTFGSVCRIVRPLRLPDFNGPLCVKAYIREAPR